jgi:hypothetical protein
LTLNDQRWCASGWIAGIYGMNFEYMPELQWRFGYPFVLVLIVGVGSRLGAGGRRAVSDVLLRHLPFLSPETGVRIPVAVWLWQASSVREEAMNLVFGNTFGNRCQARRRIGGARVTRGDALAVAAVLP